MGLGSVALLLAAYAICVGAIAYRSLLAGRPADTLLGPARKTGPSLPRGGLRSTSWARRLARTRARAPGVLAPSCLIALGLLLQFGGLLNSGSEPSTADSVSAPLGSREIVASDRQPTSLQQALLQVAPVSNEPALEPESSAQPGKAAARLNELQAIPVKRIPEPAETLISAEPSVVEPPTSPIAAATAIRDSSLVVARGSNDGVPGSRAFSGAPSKRIVPDPLPALSLRHPSVPMPPARPSELEVSFTGVWGPTTAACAPQPAARAGWLQAKIGTREARSGNTVCTLVEKQRNGDTWDLAAHCKARRTRWKSNVRLALTGDRLLWKSERGAQAYLRCDRVLMASR